MANFGSDWMFDRPRRSNEPIFGGMQRGPATDWNPEDRARVWQEPEDGRHPGGAMRDPVHKASDQRGLFDSDEDLDAYIQRMLYGTRGQGTGFTIGEGNTRATGGYAEERSALPRAPWETMEPSPLSRSANVGVEHSFSPEVQARINAAITSQPGGPPMITPSAGLNLGPLSLSGGLNIAQQQDPQGNPYTKATPTFGAGLKVPLFGGEASVNASITPDQMKILDAAWRRKLLGGEIGIGGRYEQPAQGDPRWGIGIRGRIPF